MSRKGKFTDTESRQVFAQGWSGDGDYPADKGTHRARNVLNLTAVMAAQL